MTFWDLFVPRIKYEPRKEVGWKVNQGATLWLAGQLRESSWVDRVDSFIWNSVTRAFGGQKKKIKKLLCRRRVRRLFRSIIVGSCIDKVLIFRTHRLFAGRVSPEADAFLTWHDKKKSKGRKKVKKKFNGRRNVKLSAWYATGVRATAAISYL